MDWQIEYINRKVAENILNFPDGILARYLRLTDLMIEFGPNLGRPHTKLVEKGLFELRIKAQEGIARVFFCTKRDRKIIMLHSYIKKTNKIPKRELKIAQNRLKEVINNES